jgi:putative DNA primase/helicase
MDSLQRSASLLGGAVSNGQILCPGPGHSRNDRSLSVRFKGGDFLVHSFSGQDWQECRAYVKGVLGLEEARPISPLPARLVRDDHDRIASAARIWGQSVPIDGTPAEVYLEGRGVSYQGDALRWHPSCPFGEGQRYGCMIALVRNIVTNEAKAIHRTAIDANGRKIDRKALGPIGGGAVKLTDDADVTGVIAIGEGIETTLSIRELPDLSGMPIWSVIDARGIRTFPVLSGIEAVWIAADNDKSNTGQDAARSAAKRLHDAGIEAIIIEPIETGADLNDVVASHD